VNFNEGGTEMYSLSARNSEDSYIGDLDNEKPLNYLIALIVF